MILRYLKMYMEDESRGRDYSLKFDYKVYFIRFFLYRQLLKIKFDTDGTFNAIDITVSSSPPSFKLYHFDTIKTLDINITFDYDFYNKADQTQLHRYYIELYKTGIALAAEHKEIPVEYLYKCLSDLEKDNFVYRWDFKNVTVKDQNLKIKFYCELTTRDFLLKAQVFKKGIKEPICEGVAVRTKPDYFYFKDISKNIVVRDNKVIISNKLGSREFFYLDLNDLINGKFEVNLLPPPPEMNDKYFFSFREMLMYDNDEFK